MYGRISYIGNGIVFNTPPLAELFAVVSLPVGVLLDRFFSFGVGEGRASYSRVLLKLAYIRGD